MIKIAIIIDDGFGTDKNYKKAKQDALFVQKSLQLSGFVENAEKSVWDPKQQLKWLGFSVDLEKMEWYIPEKRMVSAKNLINDIIIRLPYTSARKLSQLCGKIISMKIVMGAITQLKTRRLYSVIEQAFSWNATLNIAKYPHAIKELFFWKYNL